MYAQNREARRDNVLGLIGWLKYILIKSTIKINTVHLIFLLSSIEICADYPLHCVFWQVKNPDILATPAIRVMLGLSLFSEIINIILHVMFCKSDLANSANQDVSGILGEAHWIFLIFVKYLQFPPPGLWQIP